MRSQLTAAVHNAGGSKRRALEQRALRLSRALVDHMRTVYRELERRTGVPIAVHRALHSIDMEPGILPSQLARVLGMKRPNLSHLLRLMVEAGWVERRRLADDQRSVRLQLLPAGRTLLGATHGRAAGVLQRAIAGLASGELRQLERALRTLLARLPALGPRSLQPAAHQRRASPPPLPAARRR